MQNSQTYYPDNYDLKKWLPTTLKEVRLRGWEELDVILFSGDAYVDHPAFGASVIGRAIESLGLKVAIVPQPNWRDDLRDFKKLGRPRLFFGITSGNMDSMVNHYTAARRLRSTDAYTPGNQAGFRPDRATSVYAKIVRDLFPDSLIVAGGIEGSLRRFTHYDFWEDKLMPGIMADGNIDVLVYGMGEQTIRKICLNLLQGSDLNNLARIPQICLLADPKNPVHKEIIESSKRLESHEDCLKSKPAFARNFAIIEKTSNSKIGHGLTQDVGDKTIIVNAPEPIEENIDVYYEYPYTRLPHPKYWKKPVIPAFEMIRFSINIHRGCFGGCAFCTISTHQGKFVKSRSEESILKEIKLVASQPGFRGFLSDLGGPSANMYKMEGIDQEICNKCQRPSCMHPDICKNLNNSHQPLLDLYSRAKSVEKIKKVFIGSGVRYDLFQKGGATNDSSLRRYPEELIKNHVSGRLKVAPEHTHDHVLKIMRKPSFQSFLQFRKFFDKVNKENNLNQQLVPYFISAHPGCSLEDMAELAVETKDLNYRLQQVQDFTPTPMTMATVMFYTGLNPYTLKPVKVVTDLKQKKMLSRFFFWYKKEEKQEIRAALSKVNRKDLLKKLLE